MSKVKQWAWDEAEKAVDKIILQVKQNLITKQTAIKDIKTLIVINSLRKTYPKIVPKIGIK